MAESPRSERVTINGLKTDGHDLFAFLQTIFELPTITQAAPTLKIICSIPVLSIIRNWHRSDVFGTLRIDTHRSRNSLFAVRFSEYCTRLKRALSRSHLTKSCVMKTRHNAFAWNLDKHRNKPPQWAGRAVIIRLVCT
jgi:hypothetical protein